jgi:hypothetical protein
VPPSDDVRACAQFYKAELERGLEDPRFKNLAKAIFLIGYCVGVMLVWFDPREHPICSAVLMAVVALVLYATLQSPHKFQEKIQRLIERLDEFLAERDGVNGQ